MQNERENSHKGRLVYIATYGCQMNIRDSEVIAGLLLQEGYEIVPESEQADVIIFNTCSVRQHAEDKVWSEIGRFAKLAAKGVKKGRSPYDRRPTQIIGLVGCMAQNYEGAAFQRSPYIDFVVGPADIEKIPGIINKIVRSRQTAVSASTLYEQKTWETQGSVRAEEIYHTGYYADNGHAYVVISEGCSNFCSYCVVPYVRGQLHHRHSGDVITEIKQAVDTGIRKVTLLGQNVNAYSSAGVNFVKLLELVNQIPGLQEFSFITSHPKDTSIEVFKAMAGLEKLKKYLHLPVQAGSDRILQLMKRGYTRKMYLDLITNYRTIVTGGELTSDVIVGFPTESDRDFQDTLELLQQARFNAAFIFKYSPRPHTEAARLPDDVEQAEKERRHNTVLSLQKKISTELKKGGKT